MEKKKKIIVISAISIILLLIIAIVALLLNKNSLTHSAKKDYLNNHIITSIAQLESMDVNKPMIVFFYSPYCKPCHDFMPIFKQLAKDYPNTYNFAALNIQEPQNYTLVANNVGGVPTLYIFDTSIGNKVHISLSSIRSYNDLREELDRYLRIRSFIDLDKARDEQQKRVAQFIKLSQK